MRLILNLIWLILCGWWMAIAYILAGIICAVLIITIPFAIASFRIASYVIWPFGRSIEMRRDAGIASLIGNVIWLVLVGWGLAIGHLTAGILLCCTIIGIPLGLANFKLIPISLFPLGVRIVPSGELYPGYTVLFAGGGLSCAQQRSGSSSLGAWRRPRAGSRYTSRRIPPAHRTRPASPSCG
jgi:uncharacterized membrane protein YccF (DUF307 family)